MRPGQQYLEGSTLQILEESGNPQVENVMAQPGAKAVVPAVLAEPLAGREPLL
jgi:hypothetical protein